MSTKPRASPLEALRRAAHAGDSVTVPEGALWGMRTARALHQLAIGAPAMPRELIHAMVRIKAAAAGTNARLGRIDGPLARAIEAAANEVLEGRHDHQFPLSPWQSGTGEQTHHNVDEVLAQLAEKHLDRPRTVDADGEVGFGQSADELVPDALQLAALLLVRERLLPALDVLDGALATHASLHDDVLKLGHAPGRKAPPMTLGAEFGAWRSQLMAARAALEHTLPGLAALALGSLRSGPDVSDDARPFAPMLCRELSERTGIAFVPAPDPHAAAAGHEPLVAFHGALKTLAVALAKLANDLRLLAAGFGELHLPGEVGGRAETTQCEALAMVCLQVIANDLAVTLGAASGMLQRNTCRPLLAVNVLSSVRLLADACAAFEAHALRGLTADRERIAARLAGSPRIG